MVCFLLDLKMKLFNADCDITSVSEKDSICSLDECKIQHSPLHCLPLCCTSLSGCSQSLFCLKCAVFWVELAHEALIQEFALCLLLEEER
jgi:hypothetical protein